MASDLMAKIILNLMGGSVCFQFYGYWSAENTQVRMPLERWHQPGAQVSGTGGRFISLKAGPNGLLPYRSSDGSVMRGDQEYSPPARNSDATEALSESCFTDDDSGHDARKWRKSRRSSTRRRHGHRPHAVSPSSRRPPLYNSHPKGDPRALSATF